MNVRGSIHPLTADAWQEWRPVWQKLLGESAGASPFQDWDWISLWWENFGARSGESAHLCVVFDGHEPIGALPVVSGSVRRSPGLRLNSVQVIGNRLYDSRNIFSEYLDIVSCTGREEEVRAVVIRTIRGHFRPGEFVIGWTRKPDQWSRALSDAANTYVRIASRERSYQADLSSGFEQYVAALGASTRRSLLHLRARLEESGPVRICEAATAAEALDALDELNLLHAGRWGSPAFAGSSLRFHKALISKWAPLGRIVLTRMLAGDHCVSCLYDLRIGPTQYNIQLGFDARFARKVSLGLIHLGYAMEIAASRNVRLYDFLAGKGRKSNYKANLATTSQDVFTVQAMQGPATAALYKVVDFLRQPI